MIRVLQIGQSNALDFYRDDDSLTVVEIRVNNGYSGDLITTIGSSSITNDSTSASMTAANSLGAVDIAVGTVQKGRKYLLTEGGKPSSEVEVIATGSGTASVRFPLSVAYSTSAKAKGIFSTASWTPAATLTCRAVSLDFELSDGRIFTEEAILSTRRVACPVQLADVLRRYSRIAGHEPDDQYRAGESWKPQIDEAWNQVRFDLLAQDVLLEQIRSINDLRELVLSRFGLIVCDMGFDPLGASDIATSKRDLIAKVKAEMQRAVNSKLNIDVDGTGAEQAPPRSLRLGFELATSKQWRSSE